MSNANVSPTARLVAWLREGRDLPYCDRIALLCGAHEATLAFFKEGVRRRLVSEPNNVLLNAVDVLKDIVNPMGSMRGWAELRLRSISQAAATLSHRTVFEIGAGLSSRGLTMSEDPRVRYVESDLPGMSQEKARIARQIALEHERPNLRFGTFDILTGAGTVRPLLSGPLTIITEAVLPYYSHERIYRAAQVIRRLLERFGGAWVTCDVLLERWFVERAAVSELSRLRMDLVAEMAGVDMRDNAFRDFDQAVALFASAGLRVQTRHLQLDLVPELARTLTEAERTSCEQQIVWVLELA